MDCQLKKCNKMLLFLIDMELELFICLTLPRTKSIHNTHN